MDKEWNIINTYFENSKYSLIEHQINSYNDFFRYRFPKMMKENNPIKILKNENKDNFNLQAYLYLGGKEGDKIYYGKPTIYENEDKMYLYPSKARMQNLTYGFTIHFDLEVEYVLLDDDNNVYYNETEIVSERIFLGKFPIMLHSYLCILNNLPKPLLHNLGECKQDNGGYFIIDGKEKIIVSQEKFSDNIIYIQKLTDKYTYSAEVKSRSEDSSKQVRTTKILQVAESTEYTNKQFVIEIPNVKKPVPLFILMRALGVISDKEIIMGIICKIILGIAPVEPGIFFEII